jgi:hypothetical protein
MINCLNKKNSNSSEASALLTDCKCNPGTTGEDGSTCVFCVPDTYKETSGFTACSPCLANSTSVSGSVLTTSCLCVLGHFGPYGGPCEICAADSYPDVLGMSQCSACPQHTQSPPGSDVLKDMCYEVRRAEACVD